MAINQFGYDPTNPAAQGQNPWEDYQGQTPQQGAFQGPIDPGQGVQPFGSNGNTGITGGLPTGNGSGLSGGAGMSMGSLANPQQPNWQGSSITADQANQFIQSRGQTPFATSGDYWAKQWPGLYQRGQELGNPNYAFQRLQSADELLPGQNPMNSPYYEAPQQQAGGGIGSGYQAQGIQAPQTQQTVAPTWTAMLSNGSAYSTDANTKPKPFPGLRTQPQTLAQLAGIGQ